MLFVNAKTLILVNSIVNELLLDKDSQINLLVDRDEINFELLPRLCERKGIRISGVDMVDNKISLFFSKVDRLELKL